MRKPGDIVPNQWPTLDPGELRIAIIGQSPGEDEDHQGVPFVGRSGRLLDDALERVGLVRGRMFVGNICQRRPNKENDFDRLEWDGPWVQEGIAQLRADLEKFRPNIVLCLGNEALHLFKHGNLPLRKVWRQGRRVFDWPSKVGDWRGSLFASSFLDAPECFPERALKCLSALHPAAVCRDYSLQAYYRVAPGVGDFERLKIEAAMLGLELPQREVKVYRDFKWTLVMLDWLKSSPKPVAVDIEGGPGDVTSIAFATRRDVAHVVPLAGIDRRSVWTEEQEVAIWEAVKVILEDACIPKLVMNASYDFFALPWTYGITPQGELLDIMESFWEWQPELKLGLATQVSLLTRWPFYKPDKEEGELKFDSDEQFWTYNGHDAANTVECFEETMKRLSKGQREHFRFNVELGAAKLYMMLRGVKVDLERVKEERAKAQRAAFELQARIDQITHQDDWQVLVHCLECLKIEAMTDVEKLAEPAFARLALARLGGKNPAVPTEVVVERWQPMQWRSRGKPWVKAGKLVAVLPESAKESSTEKGWWLHGGLSYCPMHKVITRRLSFTPSTLADCEPHILESKQVEWKRVKQIWKELSREIVQGTVGPDCPANAGVKDINPQDVNPSVAVTIAQASKRGGLERPFESDLGRLLREVETWQCLRREQGQWVVQNRVYSTKELLADEEPAASFCGEEAPPEVPPFTNFYSNWLRPLKWKEPHACPEQSTFSTDRRTTLHDQPSQRGESDAGKNETTTTRPCDFGRGDCEESRAKTAQADGRRLQPDIKNLELGQRAALFGELSLLLGLGVNTGSNSKGGDSQWFLYEVCGLPRIYKNERTGKYSRESEKEHKARIAKGLTYERRRKGTKRKAVAADDSGSAQVAPEGLLAGDRGTRDGDQQTQRGSGENRAGVGNTGDVIAASQSEQIAEVRGKKVSTDQQALDLLYAYTKDERCLWVLQQRRLRKVVSDLKGELVDHDGRARSSVSFVKETGRMAESEAPHGTGLGNRQALNKDLRRIIVAG